MGLLLYLRNNKQKATYEQKLITPPPPQKKRRNNVPYVYHKMEGGAALNDQFKFTAYQTSEASS